MNQLKPPESGYQSRIRTSTKLLYRWHGAWAAATLLMCFGPGFFWHRALWLTLLTVGLDVAVGVGMILATKKFIAEMDELQRKLFLDALAIALGVGLIVGVPWTVMDVYRVIHFHANFGLLVILMGLTFLASLLYGTWRYR
jgi:hypothetical protein